MKLHDVLPLTRSVMMVEGFYRHPGEKTRIGWDPSSPLDDDFIKGTMSPVSSTTLASGKTKMPSPRKIGVTPQTRKEKLLMQKLGLTGLKQELPVFLGYNVNKEPHRAGKEKYDRILDAIKGRSGHSMDPEAFDAFMRRSVSSIRRMMERDPLARNSTRFIIIPVSSTSTIPMEFAKALRDMLKDNNKRAEIHDILEPNLKYEVGVAHDPKNPPTAAGRNRLKKMYQETILDDFKRGTRDENEMLEYLEQTKTWLMQQIEQADDETADMWKLDLEALEQAENEFTRRYLNAANPDEWLSQQRQRKQQTFGANVGKRQRKVHEIGLGLRDLVFNRLKVKQDTVAPEVTDKTMIIIADDNVDQGSTIGDAYRMLTRQGIIDQHNIRVAAAVMHNLGDAKGDFSKELLVDAREDLEAAEKQLASANTKTDKRKAENKIASLKKKIAKLSGKKK